MPTIPQLSALKKRLQELNMQKARYGISADPHINIEASDLETVVHQMELIERHRQALTVLVNQSSQFGTHVPQYITNEIRERRATVMQLRQVCQRLGQSVPMHPIDSDEPPDLPPIPTPPAPTPPTDIRAKLDQIEQLIEEIRAALN
jgi:hypothetical protein